MRKIISSAVACLLTLTQANAATPPFELIDTTGRKIEMKISSLDLKKVTGTIKSSNKKAKVPLEKLAPENLKALQAFATKHGLLDIYPDLQVSITVRDSTPRQKGSFYMRHNIMTPQMTLQGSRLEAIPKINATVLTICAETKALYREKKKIFAVKGRSSQILPAVENGEPRKFNFEPIKLKFDEDKDSSNLGGWIYKYWLSVLKDPTSGKIIRYDTSYPALRKYLEANPEKVKEFANKKIGASIPSKY